jgi:molybdate transport system substrate-binding protein
LIAALLVAGGLSACSPTEAPVPDPQRRPLVAAASSLSGVLDEIADAFTGDTGLHIEIVFGASGTLTRQIQSGAPFELFLSADEEFATRLHASGHARDEGAVYALGRLVLFAPYGSPVDPGSGIEALGSLLDTGRIRRFVIANPDLAPYGRAAEAALRDAGLWDRMRPRLVLGENVSQAAQFAASSDTSGGLIPLSIASTPAVSSRGTFAAVPEALYPPLRQRMALLSNAGPAAARFYEYVLGTVARDILERHGFGIPEGS